MDNCFDKEMSKKIINELRKQRIDHNKIIIKFLEKVIEEHDELYSLFLKKDD